LKKIKYILLKAQFLLLFIGVLSNYSYSQNFINTNQNKTFTADPNTNHIWTMTQANGGAFNDITIAVSLKKGIFRNQSDNSLTGFGTGNEIATDWSFVINSVKNGSTKMLILIKIKKPLLIKMILLKKLQLV